MLCNGKSGGWNRFTSPCGAMARRNVDDSALVFVKISSWRDVLACFLCVHVHTIIMSTCISRAFFACVWLECRVIVAYFQTLCLKYAFPSLPGSRVAAHVTRSASLSGFNNSLLDNMELIRKIYSALAAHRRDVEVTKGTGAKRSLHVCSARRQTAYTHTLRKQMWASTVCAQMPKLIEPCTIGSIECVFRIMYLCLCAFRGGWKLVFV